MFRQIISAIEYMHRKIIVHRDLKDNNILSDSKMNIKIADFGLSDEVPPGYKLQIYGGSLYYIAPEIFKGEKYGLEIDVWSLGIILYIMVTNRFPFDGETREELIGKILHCNYKIPRFLSTRCKRLLKKMLVLNPSERPSLKRIMEYKWIQTAGGDSSYRNTTKSSYLPL